MASLTLKNLPEGLLERLRQRAAKNRRSLLKEVVFLLEGALERPDGLRAGRAGESTPEYGGALAEGRGGVDSRGARERQIAEWRELCGAWESEVSVAEEIEAILAARTAGREVEL